LLCAHRFSAMQSAKVIGTLQNSGLGPKHQGVYQHPVEEIELTHKKRQQALEEFALQNVFGSHMVMRLELEKRFLSQFQRLPVLPSEMCGLDTITKRDLEMDFGDGFGAVESDDVTSELHELTEAKLKL